MFAQIAYGFTMDFFFLLELIFPIIANSTILYLLPVAGTQKYIKLLHTL